MIHRLIPMSLAAAAALVMAQPAHAGLLPVNVSVLPEAGNHRWTYAIVLPTDSQLQPGDFFTIYDFGGLVPGSVVAPEGWTVTVQPTGPTPTRVQPDDSELLPNLSFTYTGPIIGSGQTGLGNFWAVSQYQLPTDSFFAAQTHRTSDGRTDSNITETVVPVPSAPPGVPEPTTLALVGLGLPLIALARSVRRRGAVDSKDG